VRRDFALCGPGKWRGSTGFCAAPAEPAARVTAPLSARLQSA
jgi:hypothetical protein